MLPPAPGLNPVQSSRRLRQLLMLLILTLTFEGLARKAFPAILNIPIFFAKDAIILAMAYYVFRWPPVPQIMFLWKAYKIVSIMLCPLILATLWKDPLLGIYGTKQYLYYPIVGFATYYSFQNQSLQKIVEFCKWYAFLIIPTACMAILQLQLPYSNWLNCSVNGEEMGQFSAAEHLRVSATFSFVAQYSCFLEGEIYILILIWSNLNYSSTIWKFIAVALFPTYIVSCYITGSRGPVLGALTVCAVAFALVAIKFQLRNFLKVAGLLVFLYTTILIVQYFYPDAFVAYLTRENGNLLTVSSENQTRVLSPFTDWLQDANHNLFGYGLGVMSNGSDMISRYSASLRGNYGWTESDFSTTFFEGGVYLIIVWYLFRAFIVYKTFAVYIWDVKGPLTIPMAFCLGDVAVGGALGTLSLQAPVAIWWWLSVGLSLILWQRSLNPDVMEENIAGPLSPSKPRRGRSLYAETLHKR